MLRWEVVLVSLIGTLASLWVALRKGHSGFSLVSLLWRLPAGFTGICLLYVFIVCLLAR